MWYIVKAESIHWCGYSETWKVWLDDQKAFDEMAYRYHGFMADYIGSPDEEDEDWIDNEDEYCASTVEIEEWSEAEHGPLEDYEVI